MRDHRRILGTLFIVWAALQIVTAAIISASHSMPQHSSGFLAAWWITLCLLSAIYAYVGTRLRAHDPRVRITAIVLSALSLLSFPLGTALGGYGLWVLLRRSEAAARG